MSKSVLLRASWSHKRNKTWIERACLEALENRRLLDATLRLRGSEQLYLAGQITGAEGYVEAAACGLMAGLHAARTILGLPPVEVPRETALGAIVAHLQNTATADFQPANVTWTFFSPLDENVRDKRLRRGQMADRALARIAASGAAVAAHAPQPVHA